MKKLIIIVAVLFLSIGLVACKEKEKKFSKNGITVTLNAGFNEREYVGVPFYLEAKKQIFTGVREMKSDVYYASSLSEYIELVLSNNRKEATVEEYQSNDQHFYYAYYDSVVNDVEFSYMLVTLETENYYYSINFGGFTKDFKENKKLFMKWAKTIVVSEN